MITVQLLGGASLRSGDTVLGGPPAQRHRIALLTLVIAAWPQPLARDRAMAMLWPERDLASARRLLNLAVHVLRSALAGASAQQSEARTRNPRPPKGLHAGARAEVRHASALAAILAYYLLSMRL